MRVPCKNAWVGFTVIALAGCSDGLVYGERTSLDLASVRLNDDPSTPVAVKLGFDRDVILVAPPIGGQGDTFNGEAVSQFSSFSVNAGTPFANTTGWQTWVHSRFASGAAAVAIADEPPVVAALLGLTPLTRLTAADQDRLTELSACVNRMDQQQLRDLARSLDIFLSVSEQNNAQEAKQAITGRFLASNPEQLGEYAAAMQTTCPT